MNPFFNGRLVGRTAGETTRRDFLRTGALTLGTLAIPAAWQSSAAKSAAAATIAGHKNKSVVFVCLAGGPSHLDMYDMKPEAPAEICGEFRPIKTNVLGMNVCEHLPLHSQIADKFAIVNGIETIDTHSPAFITTGFAPGTPRPGILQWRTVELNTPTVPHGDWDMHGRVLGRKLSIFGELRDKLPVYDAAIHRLITNIYDRGLDNDVLVVACGEFGRTPWINKYGGRDHWAPCGSVLFAGGGLKMGQVIGDTGRIGEREQSRSQPYTAQNVLATIYRHLGVDPASTITTVDGNRVPLLGDVLPIEELM